MILIARLHVSCVEMMQSAEKQFNIDVMGKTITIMDTSTCRQYIGAVPFVSVGQMIRENWRYNRQPDDNRVIEIKKYINQHEKIDGIIYLAALHDKLVCYDGGHRLAAIDAILKDPGLGNPCSCYSPVLISFMFVDEEGAIIDHFRALNRCVSIPEIYTAAEAREDKRKVVIAVCGHYKGLYPSFFVGTTSPQLPHENKSRFESKLGELYEDLEKDGTCKNLNNDATLLKILGDQNEYYKQNIPKISAKRKQKCIAADFYLFMKRDWATAAFETYRNGLMVLE